MANIVRFEFQVTAEGAFTADLRGRVNITDAEGVHVTGSGHFGGQPVELFLRPERNQIAYGNGSSERSAPVPAHLTEAVLIGVTRMGILHNLARLTSLAPPDHAEGGVREWVVVSAFAADTADSATMNFELTVDGEPSGAASLEIDSRGRPVVRRQTVQFPSGEMRVVERYSAVTIEP